MEAFLQGSFAIAVSAFLLLRIEKKLDELSRTINLLRHCTNCKLSPWRLVPNDYDLFDYDALPGGDKDDVL